MLKPRHTHEPTFSITRRQVCVGGLVASIVGWNCATSADLNSDFAIVVFSAPVNGQDAQFNSWYNELHNPQLLRVPGFRGATRFKVALADTPASTLPAYLAVYSVRSSDVTATLSELRRRQDSGQITSSAAVDQSHSVTLVFKPVGPEMLAKDVPGSSAAPSISGHERRQYLLVVMSNPVSGREEEYNAWYDTQHLPDVLRNPGFLSGRRLQLVEVAPAGYTVPRYLAIFNFESSDLKATQVELLRRLKSGQTRSTSAGEPGTMHVYYAAQL